MARGSVVRQVFLHFLDVGLAYGGNVEVLLDDVSDFHGAVVFALAVLEGYCHVVGTVDFFADNSRTKSISVKTDKQIEQGCTISHPDVFATLNRRKNLLREITGIVLTLFKGQERIVAQLFVCNDTSAGKRMKTA